MGTRLKTAPYRLTADQVRRRTRWVKALRSGRYLQGGGCLRKNATRTMLHCCLGVAKAEGLAGDHDDWLAGELSDAYRPGLDVDDWGLCQDDLVQLNDAVGAEHCDFIAIAMVIELDTLMCQDGAFDPEDAL